jgi:hypothetical protein
VRRSRRFCLLAELFGVLVFQFLHNAERLFTSKLDLVTLQVHSGMAAIPAIGGEIIYWDFTHPNPHRCPH